MKQALVNVIKSMRANNEKELSWNIYHIRRFILLQMENKLTVNEVAEVFNELRIAENKERIRLAEERLKWEE